MPVRYTSREGRTYEGFAAYVRLIFTTSGLFIAAYILVGMFIGALLRDFGFVRGQRLLWPIQAEFFDWDKVKAAASEDEFGFS